MAYLRARRSIKLAPGVHLNLNKRSMGLSVGPRGAHYSFNTAGRRQTTVGLPGTGLSWISVHRGGTSAGRSTPPAPTGLVDPARVASVQSDNFRQHARLFAHHDERAFANGIHSHINGRDDEALQLFDQAATADQGHHHVAHHWCAAVLRIARHEHQAAIPHLEAMASASQDPYADSFWDYLPPNSDLFFLPGTTDLGPVGLSGELAPADVPIVLAGCYAKCARLSEGIGILQKALAVRYWPVAALALGDLYQEEKDWDEIVHLAASYATDDPTDVTSGLLRIQQAAAMLNLNQPDAAIEVYSALLRRRKWHPAILKSARYGRAVSYLMVSRKAAAKRDFARVYADDPDYMDVAQQVSAS